MTAPQEPMLARRQLRLAVVSAVNNIKSAAGIVTIDSPGDWNTPPEKLPAILIRNGKERKESFNRGMAEFTTVSSVEIEGRVEANTPEDAQDQIEALGYAIENAVLCDYNVMGMIQQVLSVDTDTEITAEGRRHLGGFKMTIGFEMVEAYDPLAVPPQDTTWPPVESPAVALESIGIHADMASPFDPSGTYIPSSDAPPYTPPPAPRTSGPDGRDEGALDIVLPQ